MISFRLDRAPALLLALAAFALTPMAPASATISHAAVIKRSFTALKLLPTAATSASRVAKLVERLATFDPRNSVRYYRLGMTKLDNIDDTAEADSREIALGVSKILKKSGLPASTINLLIRQLFPITYFLY